MATTHVIISPATHAFPDNQQECQERVAQILANASPDWTVTIIQGDRENGSFAIMITHPESNKVHRLRFFCKDA